jgi:hypothetical protein
MGGEGGMGGTEPKCQSPQEMLSCDKVLSIAHRGGRRVRPEHTLLAYDQALEDGADILELDVHETLDGVLVVMHDGTVDRTTDCTGPIKDRNSASATEYRPDVHTLAATRGVAALWVSSDKFRCCSSRRSSMRRAAAERDLRWCRIGRKPRSRSIRRSSCTGCHNPTSRIDCIPHRERRIPRRLCRPYSPRCHPYPRSRRYRPCQASRQDTRTCRQDRSMVLGPSHLGRRNRTCLGSMPSPNRAQWSRPSTPEQLPQSAPQPTPRMPSCSQR